MGPECVHNASTYNTILCEKSLLEISLTPYPGCRSICRPPHEIFPTQYSMADRVQFNSFLPLRIPIYVLRPNVQLFFSSEYHGKDQKHWCSVVPPIHHIACSVVSPRIRSVGLMMEPCIFHHTRHTIGPDNSTYWASLHALQAERSRRKVESMGRSVYGMHNLSRNTNLEY